MALSGYLQSGILKLPARGKKKEALIKITPGPAPPPLYIFKMHGTRLEPVAFSTRVRNVTNLQFRPEVYFSKASPILFGDFFAECVNNLVRMLLSFLCAVKLLRPFSYCDHSSSAR